MENTPVGCYTCKLFNDPGDLWLNSIYLQYINFK